MQQLGRQCRAARADEPQAPGAPSASIFVEQHLVQRRPGRQPGRAGTRGPAARTRCGVEPARGHQGRRRRTARRTSTRPGRARGTAASRRTTRRPGRAGSGRRRSGGGHQVALQQRHLLRPARGAAGVQDDRDVVRRAALEAGPAGHRLPVAQQVRRAAGDVGDAQHRGAGGGRGGRRGRGACRPASAAAEGRRPPGRTCISGSV